MLGQNPFSVSEQAQPMSEINTTPLVDVMLVLLVIFIMTAPLLTHAVKVDLPQATSKPVEEKPDSVDLAIDAEGNVFWNDQKLSEGELDQKLLQVSQQKNPSELQIRADKNTRYQVLSEVLAKAQTHGVTKLGFVSQPKQ